MRRLAPIFAILVLICVLGLLNKNINKNAVSDEDAPPAPSKSQPASPKSLPDTSKASPATADPLPPEMTIGDPKTAKHKILVGWTYTEGNQATQESLSAVLNTIRRFGEAHKADVAVESVNLDMPQEELSPTAASVTLPGIVIDGKPAFPGDALSQKGTAGQVQAALQSAVGSSAH